MAGKRFKRRGKAKKRPIIRRAAASRPNARRNARAVSSECIVLPRKLPIEPKKVVIVYGMRIDPEIVTRAAIEAYNKKRYTVHDIKLTEYIPDPKFRNLMVKIALLDRIEEELFRIYPNAAIIRPNTVTLMAR